MDYSEYDPQIAIDKMSLKLLMITFWEGCVITKVICTFLLICKVITYHCHYLLLLHLSLPLLITASLVTATT
jgi:hypothetical protein